MPIDKSALINSYLTEIREHLDEITQNLNSVDNEEIDKNVLSNILRQLHSIKGTSRLMGYVTIEKLAHGLEDVLKGIRESRYSLTPNIAQLLFLSISRIHQALQNIEQYSTDKIEITQFLKVFEQAEHGDFFDIEKLSYLLSVSLLPEDHINDNVKEIKEISEIENLKDIRVSLLSLDAVIESFDNVIIRVFKLKNEIEKLHNQDFHSSTKNLPRLIRELEEDSKSLESTLFETQNKAIALRMLPLNIVFKPLQLNFQTEVTKIKKKAAFIVQDTDIKVDKIILEQLSDIFVHLIRNSLDHGIEYPDERKKLGKNEKGSIKITTHQQGNRINISLSDDGKGLDYDEIRRIATDKFPNQASDIEQMAEKDLQSFLFMSGFSTNQEETPLSGRGVGLDIVRSNLEKIKGQISIESTKDIGTTFNLSIPLTLSIQQGIFIYAGKYKLFIPAQFIYQIVETTEQEFIQLNEQTLFRLENNLVTIYNLANIIDTENTSKNMQTQTKQIIIVEYLNKLTGFIVNSLEKYTSVVVKKLPKTFANFHAFQGVVFDENYTFVPILNIPDITQRMRRLLRYDMKKVEAKTEKKDYKILVVDDSYTTRQIEKSILEMENYIVDTAIDGIDALTKLKTNSYNLIIFDIKMPQMDGFSLIRNIRRLTEYEKVPLIVVSSLYNKETKKQFIDAGVQKYIVKSDFERGNLISCVKDLLNE